MPATCRSGDGCAKPVISAEVAHELFVSPKWCRAHAEQLSRAFHDLNPSARAARERVEGRAQAAEDTAKLIGEMATAAVEPLRAVEVAEALGVTTGSRDFRDGMSRAFTQRLAKRDGDYIVTFGPRNQRRAPVDRNHLADRLVALVMTTPLDKLPVSQEDAAKVLDVSTRTLTRAVNLATDDGRLRRSHGFVPPTYDRDRTMAAVKAHPGQTAAELARRAGITPTTVRAELFNAEADGLVRLDDGRWHLADALSSSPASGT